MNRIVRLLSGTALTATFNRSTSLWYVKALSHHHGCEPCRRHRQLPRLEATAWLAQLPFNAFYNPTQQEMEDAMDALVDKSRMVDGKPTSLFELGCTALTVCLAFSSNEGIESPNEFPNGMCGILSSS